MRRVPFFVVRNALTTFNLTIPASRRSVYVYGDKGYLSTSRRVSALTAGSGSAADRPLGMVPFSADKAKGKGPIPGNARKILPWGAGRIPGKRR